MNLLILDNYDSFTYNLLQLVEEHGRYSYVLCKNDQIDIRQVNRFDKILLSPGPGLPNEAGILNELILNYAPQKSILGICLGHQAIAEVFGGQLIQLPSVFHGAQHQVEILDHQERIFRNLPTSFEVGLYHSWAVSPEKLPKSLIITAKSSKGIIMGLRHDTWDVKGLQFHPESIMTDQGRRIIYNWLDA